MISIDIAVRITPSPSGVLNQVIVKYSFLVFLIDAYFRYSLISLNENINNNQVIHWEYIEH